MRHGKPDGAYGRPRCEWCQRVLTWREFLTGLAHGGESGNALEPDVFEHTYDCEGEPRRKTGPLKIEKDSGRTFHWDDA